MSVHPAERKATPHQSPLVSILMVHQDRIAATKDKSDNLEEIEENLTLFAKTTLNAPKNIPAP